jgi:prevent-host-death family protein
MAKALHKRSPVEVGVRELRANLSRWLNRVRKGQEVIVTDRGSPVARLAPLEEEDPLHRLVQLGLVRPPRKPKTPIDRAKLSTLPKLEGRPNLSDYVIRQREEHRAQLLRYVGAGETHTGRRRHD